MCNEIFMLHLISPEHDELDDFLIDVCEDRTIQIPEL